MVSDTFLGCGTFCSLVAERYMGNGDNVRMDIQVQTSPERDKKGENTGNVRKNPHYTHVRSPA